MQYNPIHILYPLLLSGMLLTWQGCSGQQHQPADKGGKDPADSTIHTRSQQLFSIPLTCNAGSGYSWLLADSLTGTALAYQRQVYSQEAHQPPGTDGTQTFFFKALRPGTQYLRFLYVQPFLKPYDTAAPSKTFKIVIQ